MGEIPREIWVECRVPHPCIYYVRHTADAHEGLCVASTVPHPEGRVRFLTARERRGELEALLRALAEETDLEVVQWGEGPPPEPGEGENASSASGEGLSANSG